MRNKDLNRAATNRRLNYLIDKGLSDEEIYEEMKGRHKVSFKFVCSIAAKRTREKLLSALEAEQ